MTQSCRRRPRSAALAADLMAICILQEQTDTGFQQHGALHTAGTNRHTHVFSNVALCTLREQTDTHMSSATWRFAHCENKQTHTSSATWRFAHWGTNTHTGLQQHGALHTGELTHTSSATWRFAHWVTNRHTQAFSNMALCTLANKQTHTRLRQHGALHTGEQTDTRTSSAT